MSLPWVRLDSNIAGHDKILGLVGDKDGYRAAFSYVSAIGYAGGHETDGLIQYAALPFIHGTKRTAELLVIHGLWETDPLGWRIVNYDKRQQLSAAQKAVANSRRVAGNKGNCLRWHGDECGCWEQSA